MFLNNAQDLGAAAELSKCELVRSDFTCCGREAQGWAYTVGGGRNVTES